MKTKDLSIALGLLAYNEQENIVDCLSSLLKQSVIGKNLCHYQCFEVHIVLNGCTDNTETLTRDFLQSNESVLDSLTNVSVNLHVVEQAGKANAWNTFVHGYVSSTIDFIVLMDADIEFGTEDTIEQVIQYLADHPDAVAAVDCPTKRTGNTVSNYLSRKASDVSTANVGICGQLYCARSAALKKIWLPIGLPVEDGFIAAMIKTQCFQSKDYPRAIQRVLDAFHYYEAEPGISGFLRHEKRIIIGSTINSFLFTLLWEKGPNGELGAWIRDQNVSNPGWLGEYLSKSFTSKGYWLVPRSFLFKRIPKNTFSLVVVMKGLIFTPLQIIACIEANHSLRRGIGLGYW